MVDNSGMIKTDKSVVMQALDLLEIIGLISRKNKKFQATMLQEIENIVGKDSEEFIKIRHVVLDGLNEYTRTILKAIFGTSFEGTLDNVPRHDREP